MSFARLISKLIPYAMAILMALAVGHAYARGVGRFFNQVDSALSSTIESGTRR